MERAIEAVQEKHNIDIDCEKHKSDLDNLELECDARVDGWDDELLKRELPEIVWELEQILEIKSK